MSELLCLREEEFPRIRKDEEKTRKRRGKDTEKKVPKASERRGMD
jgi:hypothetical protein